MKLSDINSKVHDVRIIPVIQVISCAGKGTEENPNRLITEYWDLDGKLLATNYGNNVTDLIF